MNLIFISLLLINVHTGRVFWENEYDVLSERKLYIFSDKNGLTWITFQWYEMKKNGTEGNLSNNRIVKKCHYTTKWKIMQFLIYWKKHSIKEKLHLYGACEYRPLRPQPLRKWGVRSAIVVSVSGMRRLNYTKKSQTDTLAE